MSYEIWSACRYGRSFGQPEFKLADELSEEQTVQRVKLGFIGHLQHNLLVVNGTEVTRAPKWLDNYRKKK